MGSIGAMKDGSKDRYFQADVETPQKLVPEGIEGRVPYKGALARVDLPARRRAARGDGLHRLRDHRRAARRRRGSCKISSPGLRESHVHDVIITKEAPNYRVE